jgi:hypothetical protein
LVRAPRSWNGTPSAANSASLQPTPTPAISRPPDIRSIVAKPKKFAIVGQQDAVFDATEAVRLVQYRVEDGFKLAGRGVDDPQHLGRRGLLLQGLPRLRDEPRVFHRDHRLGGEVLQDLNLLLSKRFHPLAENRDRAKKARSLAQRTPTTVRPPPSSTSVRASVLM